MDQADRPRGEAAKTIPFPFRLDAGWFEIRDESGRYLGLLVHCLELMWWLQRQRPGSRYRITHRCGGWRGNAATVISRWLATTRPGGWIPKLEAVVRFGPGPDPAG